MKRNFIYIINPISGTRTKKNLQQFVEKKTAEQNIPYQVYPSVASGDYSFLRNIITEQKITDVIIAGGDGTVSQVIASLMDCKVNFGIIPCGSGNGLALAAGISKTPEKALQNIFNGQPSPIDGFFVNDHFACMLCGIGFDAQVAHDFAKQPKRGLATYITQAFKNFITAKTYPFEIKTQNASLSTDAFFISIANSNQFGNNFTIAPQASLDDGLLDIVIVTSQHKMNMILQTLKQVVGWNKLQPQTAIAKEKGVIYFQTSQLSISNPQLAPLHMDGDPAETRETFSIAIKKKCFRLIQPLKEPQ